MSIYITATTHSQEAMHLLAGKAASYHPEVHCLFVPYEPQRADDARKR